MGFRQPQLHKSNRIAQLQIAAYFPLICVISHPAA
jgi:hypothetical protein